MFQGDKKGCVTRTKSLRRSLYALGCTTVLTTALATAAWAQGIFAAAPSFTAEQAAQGKTAFGTNCATCHGGDLRGTNFAPALQGATFKDKWGSQPSDALLSYITTMMPPGAQGTLDSQTYADIEDYILQANGGGSATTQTAAAAQAAPAAAQVNQQQIDEQRLASRRRALPGTEDAIYAAAMAQQKAMLDALTPVTDAMLVQPSPADWLMWRRTYDGTGYSPLDQINKDNVKNLHVAWEWSLPLSHNETTPIVHDGVLFVESATTVEALDATTGTLLWQYIRPMPNNSATLNAGRGWRIKTLAIYQNELITPTADGHVVALDVKTGKVVWDHEVLSSEQRDHTGQFEGIAYHMDGGPIVAHGKIIIGVSLGTSNGRGGDFIVGLDAQTGKEDWRFHTLAQQGEVGGNSWNGHPNDERFGGGVWTTGSYDPDLDLVYFGIGNTYDTSTLLIPNPKTRPSNYGLFTDATVALDADTGKLKWYFQHVHRDVWDLDWVFEQTLMTLPVNGKPTDMVVTAGKIALFDALNRKNGHYEFSKDMGLQNLVVGIDPKTGEKKINPTLEPKLKGGEPALICPNSSGARSWPATAYNPQTHILYVPLIEQCGTYSFEPQSPEATAKGGTDMRMTTRLRPDSDGKFGRIEAVNMETKQLIWQRRQRAPLASSMLATAGGLIFSGDKNRYFRAYDAETGDILWQTRLNAPPSATPVTYRVNGQQYVAIVSGGGGSYDAGSGGFVPEIKSPAGGETVIVFKLPSQDGSRSGIDSRGGRPGIRSKFPAGAPEVLRNPSAAVRSRRCPMNGRTPGRHSRHRVSGSA